VHICVGGVYAMHGLIISNKASDELAYHPMREKGTEELLKTGEGLDISCSCHDKGYQYQIVLYGVKLHILTQTQNTSS